MLGDVGEGVETGLDVDAGRFLALVPGLEHDQLKGDALLAEVGGGGMPELVEVEAEPHAGEVAGTVVTEPGSAGVGVQVGGRRLAGAPGGSLPAVAAAYYWEGRPPARINERHIRRVKNRIRSSLPISGERPQPLQLLLREHPRRHRPPPRQKQANGTNRSGR